MPGAPSLTSLVVCHTHDSPAACLTRPSRRHGRWPYLRWCEWPYTSRQQQRSSEWSPEWNEWHGRHEATTRHLDPLALPYQWLLLTVLQAARYHKRQSTISSEWPCWWSYERHGRSRESLGRPRRIGKGGSTPGCSAQIFSDKAVIKMRPTRETLVLTRRAVETIRQKWDMK